MHLYRPGRYEQRLRNLPVRRSVDRQVGDAPLTRRERLDAAQRDSTRTCSARKELGLGVPGKGQRAAKRGKLEPAAKRLARIGAPVRSTQPGPELYECCGVFQASRRALQDLDGLLQESDSTLSAQSKPVSAEGAPKGPWRAPLPGQHDLLLSYASGVLPFTELEIGESGLRAPCQERGILPADSPRSGLRPGGGGKSPCRSPLSSSGG